MRFVFLATLILTLACSQFAQSRRAAPAPAGTARTNTVENERPVKEMFDEVGAYLRVKAAELDAKKTRLTDSGLARLRLEQKQLAARYATSVSLRNNLAGEDFYYLGMLHWIAENQDGARETLEKFVGLTGMPPERVQTARSVLVVTLAKQKKLNEAEKVLGEYSKSEPKKLTERARMAGELARGYKAKGEFKAMEVHAAEGYAAAKKLLADTTSSARGLDEILDAGLLLLDAQRGSARHDAALVTLDDMLDSSLAAQSSSFYYYAVDSKVRYLIDLGRRDEAKSFYNASVANAGMNFTSKEIRDDAVRRLKKRDKHYDLLGLKAPPLPAAHQWFPGRPKTLDDLKGKVVLIDFWATWCKPCIEAFPAIRELNEDFKSEGFEILGVTRYYGEVAGMPADKNSELVHLKRFREMHNLPYDFVVMDDQSTQLAYGGMALPTAVLLDRQGVVRYIETGTSLARVRDLRDAIERLLAEK